MDDVSGRSGKPVKRPRGAKGEQALGHVLKVGHGSIVRLMPAIAEAFAGKAAGESVPRGGRIGILRECHFAFSPWATSLESRAAR